MGAALLQAPAPAGAASQAHELRQQGEGALGLHRRVPRGPFGELMSLFGQIQVRQVAPRRRQGRVESDALEQRQRTQADDLGGAPIGPTDAPGELLEKIVILVARVERHQQPIQVARQRPTAQLARGGVRAAVFPRQRLPGAAGTSDPEDGIERAAAVFGWPAALALGGGEEAVEGGKLGIGKGAEGVSSHSGVLKEIYPISNTKFHSSGAQDRRQIHPIDNYSSESHSDKSPSNDQTKTRSPECLWLVFFQSHLIEISPILTCRIAESGNVAIHSLISCEVGGLIACH